MLAHIIANLKLQNHAKLKSFDALGFDHAFHYSNSHCISKNLGRNVYLKYTPETNTRTSDYDINDWRLYVTNNVS